MADFFAMGGYAGFVWSAYGITALVLVGVGFYFHDTTRSTTPPDADPGTLVKVADWFADFGYALVVVAAVGVFVAGMAAMRYPRFLSFNVLGAALWVGPLVMAGYWFGNLPLIKNNLTLVIFGIILLSLLPLFVGWLRHRAASVGAG